MLLVPMDVFSLHLVVMHHALLVSASKPILVVTPRQK
jgi:hypothetical protein